MLTHAIKFPNDIWLEILKELGPLVPIHALTLWSVGIPAAFERLDLRQLCYDDDSTTAILSEHVAKAGVLVKHLSIGRLHFAANCTTSEL